MKNNTGIYYIKHTSGKMYVGSAVSLYRRKYEHKRHLRMDIHCNNKLQRAWNKYGADSFTFSTLLFCAKENLLMYEQICIDACGSVKKGYNISSLAGSQLGFKHSDETKALMSGRTRSPEHCAAISSGKKGKKLSAEARQKISTSLLGKRKSPRSNEHASKIAAALRGRPPTEEHKMKLSVAGSGKSRPAEHCANISKSKKGVPKPPQSDAHRSKISESLYKYYAAKRLAGALKDVQQQSL
jgi:group I intron endonuclease